MRRLVLEGKVFGVWETCEYLRKDGIGWAKFSNWTERRHQPKREGERFLIQCSRGSELNITVPAH